MSTGVSVGVGIGIGTTLTFCGVSNGWNYWDPYYSCGTSQWNQCGPWVSWCSPNSWWWWGTCSYWFPYCGPSWSFSYCYNRFGGYWGYGSSYYASPYVVYMAPPPAYYAAYEVYQEPVEEPVPVADLAPAQPGEVVIAPPPAQQSDSRPSASTDALSRAAGHYLTLGDRSFRDGRYSDAVHFYAKAVEYAPAEGVLRLILSDALFATGDYRYAAQELRRALELDPGLLDSIVDKHGFYGDPGAFDVQLMLLERYVQDHFLDDDARLLLAANYLFGSRADACLEILESPYSVDVRNSPAGQMLAERARALRSDAAAGKR